MESEEEIEPEVKQQGAVSKVNRGLYGPYRFSLCNDRHMDMYTALHAPKGSRPPTWALAGWALVEKLRWTIN